jgi:hypothetical protein
MDDRTIQKKLNQLVKIANELNVEAGRRWPEGRLFFESDGAFHIMSNDADASAKSRQEFVEFSSDGHCTMSAGAW